MIDERRRQRGGGEERWLRCRGGRRFRRGIDASPLRSARGGALCVEVDDEEDDGRDRRRRRDGDGDDGNIAVAGNSRASVPSHGRETREELTVHVYIIYRVFAVYDD